MRLFLRKNDLSKNPKIPYFTICVIPEEGEESDGEWKEIGAFWKAKSGFGYTGQFNEGVEVDLTNLKTYEKKPKKTAEATDDISAAEAEFDKLPPED